jgi:predicted phage terminase large subunit-like protein
LTRVIRKTVKLHQAQRDFCRSAALYRGFVGGRGSGKSWAISYDMIRRARRGRLYMMASPTYTILRDTDLRAFVTLARELGVLLEQKVSPPSVLLTTGAEILFRSADDPERLRGPNLSGVSLNEASLMPREAYQICIASLREHGEQGFLSAGFTPKGRTHWTYEVFGGEKPKPDTAIFHARTRDNPFNPAGFQDRIAAQYGGLLALQELEGQFVSVEGAEWPPEYFPDDIWFDTWPAHPTCKVSALDPSKGKDAKSGDYAAFVDLAVDGEGTLWVEAELLRGQAVEVLVDTAIEHQQRFRPDAFAVEVNQFQELLCVLIQQRAANRHVLVPVVPIDNRVNKLVRIRRLGPYLFARRVRFRDTPGTRLLVDQLREFPEGPHDDAPDSLEMAVRVAADLLAGVLSMRADEEDTIVVHA